MDKKNKKLLLIILTILLPLIIINNVFSKSTNRLKVESQVTQNSENNSYNEHYIPVSDIITVNSPTFADFGNFKIYFPSRLATNKEIIDCNSGYLLPKDTKILVSGFDGALVKGWGYAIGVSQTQINPTNDPEQIYLCTGDYPAILFEFNVNKKKDYLEAEKSGFEGENLKFIQEEKIRIGNLEIKAKIYEYTLTQTKPGHGQATITYKLKGYHFNIGDNYYIIKKPTYDGTIETAFDDKVLNDAIDYIWNNLEFTQ